MSRDDCGAPDWMDNLELRINRLEAWRDAHVDDTIERVRESTQMSADIIS
jgi:hypothetical protein